MKEEFKVGQEYRRELSNGAIFEIVDITGDIVTRKCVFPKTGTLSSFNKNSEESEELEMIFDGEKLVGRYSKKVDK